MNLGIESSPSATVVDLVETDALYGQFPYPVVQSGTNKKTTVTAARGGHDFPRPAPDIGNRAWLAAVLLVLLAGEYCFRGFFFKTQDLTGRVFQYSLHSAIPTSFTALHRWSRRKCADFLVFRMSVRTCRSRALR